MGYSNSPRGWRGGSVPYATSASWPISKLESFSSTCHPSDRYPPTRNSEEPNVVTQEGKKRERRITSFFSSAVFPIVGRLVRILLEKFKYSSPLLIQSFSR